MSMSCCLFPVNRAFCVCFLCVKVLKIELPKGITGIRDKWNNALGREVRNEHKRSFHWDND